MSTPAAADLYERVRPPRGAVAVAVVDPAGEIWFGGDAPPGGLFEAGSLTKPMTALVLSSLVGDGDLTLGTTVGDILGDQAGGAASATLVELATHTAGLPRIAPNAMKQPFWPRDPYRFYGERRLFEGLARTTMEGRGRFSYSNFGYTVLALCLATVAGRPLNQLLAERVFEPLGMAASRCQPGPSTGLVGGHAGSPVIGGRRWHLALPGAGGVDTTIEDLAAFARANLLPDATPLAGPIALTHERHFDDGQDAMGLAWKHAADGFGHEGGTGRYGSLVRMVPGRLAVAVLVGMGPGPSYALGARAGEWLDEHLD